MAKRIKISHETEDGDITFLATNWVEYRTIEMIANRFRMHPGMRDTFLQIIRSNSEFGVLKRVKAIDVDK